MGRTVLSGLITVFITRSYSPSEEPTIYSVLV
jgi:hypothetical protein